MNEYSRFGAAFTLLNRAAHAYFSDLLEPYALNPAQQGYLLVIEPDEEVNQDEIARRHQVDKANAARAVSRLERSGYVTRRPAPHDRRNRLVSLTPRGVEVRAAVEHAMQEWVDVLKSSVPRTSWETMLAGIEQMAAAAAGFASRSPNTPVGAADGDQPTERDSAS